MKKATAILAILIGGIAVAVNGQKQPQQNTVPPVGKATAPGQSTARASTSKAIAHGQSANGRLIFWRYSPSPSSGARKGATLAPRLPGCWHRGAGATLHPNTCWSKSGSTARAPARHCLNTHAHSLNPVLATACRSKARYRAHRRSRTRVYKTSFTPSGLPVDRCAPRRWTHTELEEPQRKPNCGCLCIAIP